MGLRTVTATRYVTPLREGGSLPGLVEADDDGLYVLKFRGAGQGVKALVAELVLVDVDPALGRAEPDPEIQELITASGGLNVGVDFLPGALPFDDRVDAALAADVVWFDALVTNVDRTPRNPNLLCWHERLWLIDHGAALYAQHQQGDFAATARRPFPLIEDHVLLPYAGPIAAADERLAPRATEGVIEAVACAVPAEWVDDREVYAQFLRARLAAPRDFAEEAERARSGA